jgi:acyl-coenzyme A thioesterase PaaI-like protein
MTTTHNIFELFDLIGFRQVNSSDDEVVLELPVAPHVVNTNGGLQGGLLATLVDAAAGGLAMRQLAPGESVATSDLRRHRELRDYRRPPPTGVSQTIERSRSPAI